eukprot:gene23319-24450_t
MSSHKKVATLRPSPKPLRASSRQARRSLGSEAMELGTAHVRPSPRTDRPSRGRPNRPSIVQALGSLANVYSTTPRGNMNGTAGNANGRQSTADGGLLQGTGAPPRSFSESSASTHDDGRGGISTLSNGHGSYGGVPYSVDDDDDENAGGGGGGGGSGGGGRDRDRGVAREADYSMVSS